MLTTVRRLLPWAAAPLIGALVMVGFLLLRGNDDKTLDPSVASGQAGLPGTPVAPEKLQAATDFKGYPLWWAGNSFDSFNLTHVDQRSPETGFPTMNSVDFIYGRCTVPAGAESCAPPLSVVVEPLCQTPLEKVKNLTDQQPFDLRGAQALWVRDHLDVWTGDSTITIFSSSRDSIMKAADSLVPLGNVPVSLVGSKLPPPNFDKCPSYVEPTLIPHPEKLTPAPAAVTPQASNPASYTSSLFTAHKLGTVGHTIGTYNNCGSSSDHSGDATFNRWGYIPPYTQ